MYGQRHATTCDGTVYAPGAKFRVLVRGAYLDGMVPEPGYRTSAWGGWRQDLNPGDIVTCTGYGAGWGGDPGYGVEFTSERSEADGAIHCEIRPSAGSIFDYHPAPGVLEPVTDEETGS